MVVGPLGGHTGGSWLRSARNVPEGARALSWFEKRPGSQPSYAVPAGAMHWTALLSHVSPLMIIGGGARLRPLPSPGVDAFPMVQGLWVLLGGHTARIAVTRETMVLL